MPGRRFVLIRTAPCPADSLCRSRAAPRLDQHAYEARPRPPPTRGSPMRTRGPLGRGRGNAGTKPGRQDPPYHGDTVHSHRPHARPDPRLGRSCTERAGKGGVWVGTSQPGGVIGGWTGRRTQAPAGAGAGAREGQRPEMTLTGSSSAQERLLRTVECRRSCLSKTSAEVENTGGERV